MRRLLKLCQPGCLSEKQQGQVESVKVQNEKSLNAFLLQQIQKKNLFLESQALMIFTYKSEFLELYEQGFVY